MIKVITFLVVLLAGVQAHAAYTSCIVETRVAIASHENYESNIRKSDIVTTCDGIHIRSEIVDKNNASQALSREISNLTNTENLTLVNCFESAPIEIEWGHLHKTTCVLKR